MFDWKRILVPVDGSTCAETALKYALALVGQSDTELVLLYVVEPMIPPTAYITPMGGYSTPYVETTETANDYLKKLEPSVTGPHRMLVRHGMPAEQIVSTAREEKVDGILMGTHGRRGLSRMLMGSTTENVMRNATVPVITVRPAVVEARLSQPLPGMARMTPV